MRILEMYKLHESDGEKLAIMTHNFNEYMKFRPEILRNFIQN